MPETLLTMEARVEILADRLAQLPRFYGYKDVLTGCFADDEDVFVDALCGEGLPRTVRQACLDTMQPRTLEIMILRRISRQLGTLLARESRP